MPKPYFDIKIVFPGIGVPIIKMRYLFITGFPMLVGKHLYAETGPRIFINNIQQGLSGIGLYIIKIRWSHDSLIFIIEIPITRKTVSILTQSLGGRLNIKMLSFQYNDPQYRDLTTVLSLTWESPFLERRSLYWEGAKAVYNHAGCTWWGRWLESLW